MMSVHGWLDLSDDTYESDWSVVDREIAELEAWLEPRMTIWTKVTFEQVNWDRLALIRGCTNHRTADIQALIEFLDEVARRLPGSYGVVYCRDDHAENANEYSVYVVARGKVTQQADPFLSPCNPVIED